MNDADAGDCAEQAKQRGLQLASLSDFQAAGCETPLAGSRKVYCHCFGSLYEEAAQAARQAGNGPAQRVYSLLSAVTQTHFKPRDQVEPYGPLLVMGGRRSVIPYDLRGEQSAVFAQIAPAMGNPGLRARLADIAWLNDRKQSASAQLAISSYVESVRLVMDGKAELFFEDEKATSHNAAELLRRACQIASQTKWKEAETAPLKDLVQQLTHSAFEADDARGYLNIGELDLD
jgi:hypothetical protein